MREVANHNRKWKRILPGCQPYFFGSKSQLFIYLPLAHKREYKLYYDWSIVAGKNHLRLLKAFLSSTKEYSNVRLYIVGQGVMKSELVSFTQEQMLADKVVFIDYLVNPYPLLKLCDCFVLSSDIEGQPMVILKLWH